MDLGQKKTPGKCTYFGTDNSRHDSLGSAKKKKLERALIVDMILLGQKSLKVH